MKVAVHHTALATLLVTMALACGGDEPPAESGSSGGSSGDPNNPNPNPTPDAPPPPPPEGQPIVEGVFVSASKGDDLADGSREKPLKTLTTAIPVAKARGQAVVACAETYPEAVKLVPGVTMYGYVDCNAGWVRVPARAVIASPTSPAVLAEAVDLPVRFEGFEVNGPDVHAAPADGPAKSSYGMIIKQSKHVRLAEVTIRGGVAQDGIDGVEPATNNVDSSQNKSGASARRQEPCVFGPFVDCNLPSRQPGAAGGTSTCAAGTNGGPGGQGGDGPFYINSAVKVAIGANANGRPSSTTALTAQGALESGLPNNTPGASGTKGAAGELGQNGVWLFVDGVDAFVPGNGTDGKIGQPGKGGGGGAGAQLWWVSDTAQAASTPGPAWGLSGAGGGAGGCGGIPGSGGTGGGASVGLVVISSEQISIMDSQLKSGAGGRGGKGALGFAGLSAAGGGQGKHQGVLDARPVGIYGSRGGDGGAGGDAGLSGHGAVGPSIALVYHGAKPEMTQVELLPGAPGAAPPTTTRGPQTQPAPVGITKAEHSF